MASTSRLPFCTPKNTAQTRLALTAVHLRPRTWRCPGWLHRRLRPSRYAPTWAIRSKLRMALCGARTPKPSRALASNGGMPVPQWWAVAVELRRLPRRRWPRRSIYKGQNRSIRGRFFYCLRIAGTICPNGECRFWQVAGRALRVYPMRIMIQTL